MYYKSKTISLGILLLTSIILASVTTHFFSPENKTTWFWDSTLALIFIYGLSLIVYIFPTWATSDDVHPNNAIADPTGISVFMSLSFVRLSGVKRLLFVVLVQIIIATGIWLYWN